MFIPRNLNSNFGFQICLVTGWDFPVTSNPDPRQENFPVGNQNLGCYY
jgi:hypothetical protein